MLQRAVLEGLESRQYLTVYAWDGTSNNWNVASHWTDVNNSSHHALPGAGDTGTVSSGSALANGDLSGAPLIQVNTGGSVTLNAWGTTLNNAFALSGGTLAFNNGGERSNGTITLLAQSTISYNASNSVDVYSPIVGTGKLIITGNSNNGNTADLQLRLRGSDTYSGGTDIQGAAPAIYNLSALGTGPVTVENGAKVNQEVNNWNQNLTLAGGTYFITPNEATSGTFTLTGPSALKNAYNDTGTDGASMVYCGLLVGSQSLTTAYDQRWTGLNNLNFTGGES